MNNLKHLRREYKLLELDEKVISSTPFKQFSGWLHTAIKSDITDATAMTLSTVAENCRPSSRIVLLKQFNEKGFDFFTNYGSRKGLELEKNPYASILFYWPSLERQVRIEGKVVKITEKESDVYFSDRPVESQIAAWASPQSTVIKSRKTLMEWYEEMNSFMNNEIIQRPSFWGGYRLIPDLFEFWQGRENRLHDRIEYYLEGENWQTRRLAP